MSEKIVLREITYEQMSTLVTELKTNNFVKDKEIERLNNIINELEKVANARMNTILKIEQYLVDSGVDDDTLKYCDIYDVNGVELRKYIEELKGSDKNDKS